MSSSLTGESHLFGEMAEWFNALVLKTSEAKVSGDSNSSFSAVLLVLSTHKHLAFIIIRVKRVHLDN